ncbi:MAG: erythromycin esterase family protein [Acidobacteriota bacterium]
MGPPKLACALGLWLLAAPAVAQTGPANLDFEQGEPGSTPPGWFVPQMLGNAGYSAELRRQGCRNGGCAVVLVPANPPPQTFGNLMQRFDAAPYRGKTIRFQAWVRLEPVDPQDRAQLWLRVDRPNRQMGLFDNMDDRPVRSPAWTRCEIAGEIDADAEYLNLGVMSLGRGRAWIDDASLEIVPPASGADTGAARDAIQALYRRIDEAYEKGQIDAIAALALPEATIGSGPIRLPLRAALDQMRALVAKATIASRSTVTSARLSGTDAVVSVRNEGSYSSPDGRRAYINTFSDTWTRTAEGWKLKASTQLASRASAPPTDAETTRALAAELKRHAVPLATVQAGNKLDDLAAFGRAVGEARIVALGEATHGTREFFKLKHRLLEYLVKEKGFTVFAIEANWPESLAVDRYIKTGEGDPKAALAGMYFWTWNTQEVLDMIEWMRAYNKAPGDHPILTFTSFDMQTPDVAADRVLEYLRKTAPEEVAAAETAYGEVRKLGGQMADKAAKGVAEQAEGIVKLLDARREVLVRASSPEAWRDARQAAEIVRQATAMRSEGTPPGYRDEMMARNVEWLAREVHPNEKLVLWAHNGHVRLAPEMGFKSMGAWLGERFGRRMYVVGFAFRRGEVRAMGMQKGAGSGLQNHTVPPSPEGSGDAVLSAAGMPLLFLDMRSVPAAGALARWLAEPHLHLSAGAIWNRDDPESNLHLQSLAKSYDGLIFVEEGHAAVGLSFSRP